MSVIFINEPNFFISAVLEWPAYADVLIISFANIRHARRAGGQGSLLIIVISNFSDLYKHIRDVD